MLIQTTDASVAAPKEDAPNSWGAWHWFWAKVFGRRMPTSAARAHIGNLLLRYDPQQSMADFRAGPRPWSSDARHIYKIGDLWVYDYGDTPFYVAHLSNNKQDLGPYDGLLKENVAHYPEETCWDKE